MSLAVGIVGLANVGKSTLFNALTSSSAALAANYPFATIEPNVGIVPVPDERLAVLAKMYESDKIVPATVKFVDIAGLVRGASKGEGLGNKFLANIRECDVICHVVRAFAGGEVTHVDGEMNPQRDIETINTELALADIETAGKLRARAEKEVKANPKRKADVEAIDRVLAGLESGDFVRLEELEADKLAEETVVGLRNLMTMKPVVYMFNMADGELANEPYRDELAEMVGGGQSVFVSAKLEEEMVGMGVEDKMEFLASYGVSKDGLSQLIRAAYETLGLQSYLTAGKKEVRAWTVRRGATAPEAAGVIHTDFQRGFIAASVMNYDDLVALGSEAAVKAAGKMRTEGKEYVVREGDIMEFRFNV
jgi:GTP-binding protein YchF